MNVLRAAGALLAGLALAVLAGCSGDSAWDPAPYPAATPTGANGSPSPHPSGVIVVPESYVELRTVCDHGNRLYLARWGNSGGDPVMTVIPNDPSCKETPK